MRLYDEVKLRQIAGMLHEPIKDASSGYDKMAAVQHELGGNLAPEMSPEAKERAFLLLDQAADSFDVALHKMQGAMSILERAASEP